MKNLIKRYLPPKHKIQGHKYLHLFGKLLHDPDIWHLTRRSAAGGVAIGLFCAFIPLPIHTATAAIIAIVLRVNLPLALLLTLISNPITFAPLFLVAYKTGIYIFDFMGRDAVLNKFTFEFTMQWFTSTMIQVWKPLLIGCFLLGSASAFVGYVLVRLLWRLSLLYKWGKRRAIMARKNRLR